MSRAVNQRIQVPDDLREVLLEFTISYLLEQPADVVNYAADYFTRLRESRVNVEIVPPPLAGDGEVAPTSPDESVISNEEEVEEHPDEILEESAIVDAAVLETRLKEDSVAIPTGTVEV